jgi:PAS domain S-box-containing protein
VIPVPNRGVIFGIGHDITDRKQAETALRASEAKYRRLYQSIRDGVVTVNMDGRIQQFNEAYCQMLGYSPDELLALTYQDLTPSRWHSFEAAIVRDQVVSRKYSNTYEKEYRRQDGTIFPVELRTYLITDENGQPAAMWGIVRDITERKQAEAALRQARDELEQRVKERTAELRESNALLQAEVKQRRAAEEQLRASQERFELAVRGVGVGIWDWDIRTGIVYYSPRWKRLFGYAENEIGEGFEDWTKLLHPDEREWITKFQEDFLAGTSSTITAEYRLRHKDGSYRWIAAHAVVVRDEQGKACRLVGSHGDITERKEAEEKLEAERRALQRMLLASDHDREMVTYEIHDGVAQRLLGALMQFEAYKQIATYESEKLRTTFEAGLQALREASAEARSLMNRTRTPVLAKFGIKAAIADFIDQISEMLNAPEVTYRCEVQFRRLAPTIENAIFRVAQEAIVNAFRHSQSELVRVSLVQDGEEVTLEVQDNGMGFDPASVGASRFGLDGIRERARAFGKDLQLDSTPGQGTRIRVTFPVISPSA